jgi:3-phosphoshikimate 1-carboxyvinyltransferase
MSSITLTAPKGNISYELSLGGSKSISNRVLLLQALSGKASDIYNLSEAEDCRTMQRLLANSNEKVLDAGDAGTAYRFITAYLALKPDKHFLTGSKRMLERPIAVLVEALNQLGCKINYASKFGYPPLVIEQANLSETLNNEIYINAAVSSQYISALLMIAPNLPNGLILNLEGKTVSEPYIDMTINLMSIFGAELKRMGNRIIVKSGKYHAVPYEVESDWSSASYFYAMAAVSDDSFKLKMNKFFKNSVQADARIVEIMKNFGVETIFHIDGFVEISKNNKELPVKFEYDFTNCPDIAQTIAVVLAALNIPAHLSGLETLKIKETDRIAALKTELEKLGAVVETDFNSLSIVKGINHQIVPNTIATYKDHRMAMAFAPLSLIYDSIKMDNKEVVAKSYPSFWTDLQKLGFKIK